MIPNGMFSRLEASCATSWPTRVTLNAVFLIVSQSTSKFSPRTFFQSMFDNTRAGNADIDDGIRLGYAVESACHERVVVRCIAENNEFLRIQGSCSLCLPPPSS